MCKRKCYHCKQMFDEKDGIQVLKHFICKECYNDYTKTDGYCKEKFLDIVWQTYVEKPNFYQLVAQYDNLVKEYNFTPQGLLYALQYYMKRREWNTDYLLHQAFPSLYYEARDYYIKENKIKQKLGGIDLHKPIEIKGNIKSYKPPLELKWGG